MITDACDNNENAFTSALLMKKRFAIIPIHKAFFNAQTSASTSNLTNNKLSEVQDELP